MNNYNSACKQDQFAATILNFLNNGIYIDIGSAHSKDTNNSLFFDNELNWRGICIEQSTSYNGTYNNRKNCKFINEDATKINYQQLFSDNNIPEIIDYLSLDVDALSLTVLSILPFNNYKFKVITIEHDAYLYGDTYREPQREILHKNGYVLLCGNVYVEEHGDSTGNREFEDWWIHPDLVDKDVLNIIKSVTKTTKKSENYIYNK
jgi:hypothetical protein